MSILDVKSADMCRFDLVALGEVLLRFDPGDRRISTAESFRVWEGGGEYNVARGLSQCFNMRSGIVTALVDNEIGRLIKNRVSAGGVDTTFIKWLPDDGIGESRRNGIYFLEKGFGIRPALGVFDRGHSAVSQMKPGDVDWERVFDGRGVRWFHTGGIMAGLSPESVRVIVEAMQAARKHGVIISYDLNYRPSLWKRFGGKQIADEVNQVVLEHVDVLFGLDLSEPDAAGLEAERFRSAIIKTAQDNPHLKVIASSMRFVKSANVNEWSGLLCHAGKIHEGPRFEGLEIYDRVGGGDGFAAGVIYGLLTTGDPQTAVDYGVAHGALVMTTPGDTSMATLQEVEKVLAGEGAGAVR